MLPGIIGENQGAFLKGRSLHENFKLVRESAVLKEIKCNSLLLKLDIAKAFDTVEWQFLLEVLRKVGFGPNWCTWIAMLLRTASTQILLNGIPGHSFRHGRGLRQGDALSHLLFILVMDILCNLFAKAKECKILDPFCNRHAIYHNGCPYRRMML